MSEFQKKRHDLSPTEKLKTSERSLNFLKWVKGVLQFSKAISTSKKKNLKNNNTITLSTVNYAIDLERKRKRNRKDSLEWNLL